MKNNREKKIKNKKIKTSSIIKIVIVMSSMIKKKIMKN